LFDSKDKNSLAAHLKQIIKFALWAVFAVSIIFLLRRYYNGQLEALPKTAVKLPTVEYLIDTGDVAKQSCERYSSGQCFDTRSNTDFLYEEEASEAETDTLAEEMVSLSEIIKEEPSAAADVFYQKLAELENADKQPEEVSDEENEQHDELLAKIYEEELPTDVIDDDEPLSPEQLADGYHVFTEHKDVKSLNIIPAYKPAYFGEMPVIAVVIDDMGISRKRTADIISLQAPLTASFLTYGQGLDEQVKNAKEAGLEIMVHTPMEPHSKADLAPDTLTTQMNLEEIKNGLNIMLDKFHDVKGINNHMGSKLTEDFERMNAVMEVLNERDLFFLDSKTTAFSAAKKAARQNHVSYATRHVFLDNENKVDYILKQLSVAERIARRNGYAVAIGHPKTGTYQALKQWIETLPDKKLKLVHLSNIVKELNH